jgi:isoquinoline 1-oxidoreductase
MSEPFVPEPERYECAEGPAYTFDLTRRELLALGGAGILVTIASIGLAGQETAPSPRMTAPPAPDQVSAWLHIDESGRITGYTGKVEIGQNIRTSLAQAIADELSAPLASVAMIMGDTDLTPFDIGTVGSFTTPQVAPQIRRAAAAARALLIDLAAARWSVPAGEIDIAEGVVRHAGSGRSARFGELTRGETLTRRIEVTQATRPATSWSVAGTAVAKVDRRAVVTGERTYVSDLTRPGMLVGKIVRPPSAGAALMSVDDAAARRVRGATVVRDGSFIGVAAAKPWVAEQAAAAVAARWTPLAGQPSSATIFEYLKSHAQEPAPRPPALAQALAGAARTLTRAYTVPFIAHVPLEPRAALAEWNGGRLTVWVGTQRPFAVREELAQAFRIPAAQVRVIVPDFGSGYGGKHTGEVAVEAARLARGTGAPVKLVWTRAEEFQWAYFRPAGVIEITSGVDTDGRLIAWDLTNYHSGRSAIDGVYNVAETRTQFVTLTPPLRSGSYRALAATANTFAREVHVDELAALAGIEPLAFRLQNIVNPRARAVLEAAAQRFGWPTSRAAGRGAGIAVGFDKGGYVATAVELEPREGQEPRLSRVTVAFECGAIVNPDGLRHQIAGAVIQGIGGALFEAIDFADGRVLNGSLRQYRVPRFTDIPPIDVVMLNRPDLPSAGAGETPIIGLAPAVANALAAAGTGRRHSLPLSPARSNAPQTTTARQAAPADRPPAHRTAPLGRVTQD